MKRLIALFLLFPAVASAQAVHEAQFGVAETFPFLLFNSDGTLDVDEVDGGAEVSLICDQAAASTATNDFTDEGSHYAIALSAAELECETVVVEIAATDTNVFIIETFGDYRAFDKTRGAASGTAQTSSSTTLVLESDTNIPDDHINNRTVCITVGTGVGQCRLITDYVQSTDTATVATWDTTPDTTSGYIVHPGNQASTATLAAAVADAVPDEDCTGHTGAGTIGEQWCTNIPAILDDTGTDIPNSINTLQDTADNTTLYASTVATVTSPTQFDVDGADDPGADDWHAGLWLCVEDASDADAQDCARIVDYDSANNRWTIEAALRFTVAIGDKIWIPTPSNQYRQW